jgi:LysM repeat protein
VELTIKADSPQPNNTGQQVIKIRYLIRNTGTRAISGPVIVTSDKTAVVNCPPINSIGNFDSSLAPTEEIIECTADYPLTNVDISTGSLTNTASATVGTVRSAPVTASLPIGPAASPLKLTTSANPATYSQADQAITFTYVIQNTGTANLGPAQFTVTDNLTAAAPFNCGLANSTLAPSATVTCTATYKTTQNDLTAVSVTNIATASGGGVAPSAAASTTINRSITTLALTTSANPTTYNQADQTITFTYVLKNTTTGNLGPAQFTVRDSLVNAAPFNCGPLSTTLVPNATVTCTATYRVTQNDLSAVSITNIATGFDGTGGSSPSASATVAKATDGQHTVVKGEWLWQIARCYGVNPRTLMTDNQSRVSDPRLLQPGTVLIVRNPGGYSKYYGPPCVENYTVKAGDSWDSIAQAYSADPTILRMVNVSRTLSAGTIIVVPKNSSSGSTVPIQTRALALTTSANPTTYTQAGQAITFTYVIRNSGNITLGPAQFTVGDSLIQAAPFNCGLANSTLAPNATVTCTAIYTTTQNDMTAVSITNIATASGGGAGPSPSASATVNKGAATLALTTSANPTTYEQAGQSITFTYVITNNGTTTLGPTQFTVSDTLISTTPLNCGPANTTLAPNTTATCTAAYTTTQNDMTAVSITNIATASGGGASPSPAASATVNKSVRALSLTTSATPTTYSQAGQTITFVYVIKNNGTMNLGPAQFTVADSLVSATPINCGAANITLAPNSTVICTGTYTTTQNDLTAVSITNIATASGGGVGPSPAASAVIARQ